MASALILAGATACRRDNSAAVVQDTASVAPGERLVPRAATASPSAERQDTSLQGDSAVAGYVAMERAADTTSVETADATAADTSSTEMAAAQDAATGQDVNPDTAAAGYVAMARDTSTTIDQIDTTGVAASDDGAIQFSVDTSHVDAEVTADADVSTDSGIAAGAADTTGNTGRIHPPEDSTEILGMESERIRSPEGSTEILGYVTSSETADEEPINENEQEIGAAAIGGTVTGAEAVGLMTREGVRCGIVDPESNEEVRWDMSSTPVTLNPCGLGSMVLSKIWTARGERQE